MSSRLIKRLISGALALTLVFSINGFAAVVTDNDGSAFITKAEFDSLKNSFQAQIDSYNQAIDSKIDGAIAAYLAGIRLATIETVPIYAGDSVELANLSDYSISEVWQCGRPRNYDISGGCAGNGNFNGLSLFKLERRKTSYNAVLYTEPLISSVDIAQGIAEWSGVQDSWVDIALQGINYTESMQINAESGLGFLWPKYNPNGTRILSTDTSTIFGYICSSYGQHPGSSYTTADTWWRDREMKNYATAAGSNGIHAVPIKNAGASLIREPVGVKRFPYFCAVGPRDTATLITGDWLNGFTVGTGTYEAEPYGKYGPTTSPKYTTPTQRYVKREYMRRELYWDLACNTFFVGHPTTKSKSDTNWLEFITYEYHGDADKGCYGGNQYSNRAPDWEGQKPDTSCTTLAHTFIGGVQNAVNDLEDDEKAALPDYVSQRLTTSKTSTTYTALTRKKVLTAEQGFPLIKVEADTKYLIELESADGTDLDCFLRTGLKQKARDKEKDEPNLLTISNGTILSGCTAGTTENSFRINAKTTVTIQPNKNGVLFISFFPPSGYNTIKKLNINGNVKKIKTD